MTFLIFPLFPVVSLGIIALSFHTYFRVTRRGYTPPTAGLVVIGCWTAGIFVLVELANRNAWLVNDRPLRFMIAIFGLPALAMAVVPLVLPRRPHRTAGVRRVRLPLVFLSWCLFALAVVVVVLPFALIVSGSQVKLRRAGQLASLLATGGWYLRYLDRLRKKPTIAQAGKNDPRPPVLYLRAFNQERDHFALAPPALVGRTANPVMKRAVEQDHADAVALTLEQYLGPEIERDLGPLVALGSPEDYLPPEGAARTYADDRDWTRQFETLAAGARAIVMEVSQSDNLRWELEWLRSHHLQTKLIVVTRPSPPPNLEWLTQAWYHWLPTLRGVAAPRWEAFATHLSALGYSFGFEHAGPGAVIGFDDGGRAAVLACGVGDPRAYVAAMKRRLTPGSQAAECPSGSCRVCGRVSPLLPAGTDTPPECAACADARLTMRLSPREQWKRLWGGNLFWWWFFFVGPAAFIGIAQNLPDRLRKFDSVIWIVIMLTLLVAFMPTWMRFFLSDAAIKHEKPQR